MMELIKREDAIREMFRFKGYIGFDEDMLYRIEYALNQIPTIPAPRWVRVGDELPKPIHPSDPHYMPYLICDSLGYMHVADYTYGKYSTAYSFHVDGEEVTDVRYWMPIEPPKEDA